MGEYEILNSNNAIEEKQVGKYSISAYSNKLFLRSGNKYACIS